MINCFNTIYLGSENMFKLIDKYKSQIMKKKFV